MNGDTTASTQPEDEGAASEGAATEGATGAGAAGPPRPKLVALDWDGLEGALLRPVAGTKACLDTHSGEVIELTDGRTADHAFSEQELAEGLVSGRLIAIEPLPPQTAQGWMVNFVTELEDGWARDVLQQALAQLFPMRSFEEALGPFPMERQAWLARREACEAAVLRAWLEVRDIEPTTERTPKNPSAIAGSDRRRDRLT